jgi:hypothetical protein
MFWSYVYSLRNRGVYDGYREQQRIELIQLIAFLFETHSVEPGQALGFFNNLRKESVWWRKDCKDLCFEFVREINWHVFCTFGFVGATDFRAPRATLGLAVTSIVSILSGEGSVLQRTFEESLTWSLKGHKLPWGCLAFCFLTGAFRWASPLSIKLTTTDGY